MKEAMNRNIVIFGGSGFIGNHLIRTLAKNKQNRLISVDLREPETKLPGVDYRTNDVRDLTGFDVEGEVDCIYNLAAVHTTPGHETYEYYQTNIGGATQVTAFARRRNVKEIVFASSISVYGVSEEPKSERSDPAPETAYGWSKLLAEGIHRSWLDENNGRRLIIMRPAVIFGQGEGGNFTRLARLLRKGFFIYPGRKDTVKACYYVGDLIRALLFAQSQPDRYILFNACYPDRYTISEIVETMKKVHFFEAVTFVVPGSVLAGAATALLPFSKVGLGVHPERVLKLVRSTDIRPIWLEEHGYAARNQLTLAIEQWRADTQSRFD
jgi:GlcNAc-P-P-Und epimerase